MVAGFSTTWAKVRGWSVAERLAGAATLLAGGGLLAWAALLRREWGDNPDLSHGFLALPAVVLLWIRARADARGGARRGLPGGAQAGLAGAAGVALAGALLLLTVYAVALGWRAAPTLFLAGAAAALGVALAATSAAGRAVRWIAPGWPALVMVAVVLLSSPLPPGTYARLTGGLQELITVGVVETLRLVGIPALRTGNIINLGHTSVGVEEACSGVRSLVSCVVAGLALSALLLRRPGRRVLLVALAAPLALLTNFLRSLTLTLLARGGVDISGAWHDGLGFAVLGVTTAVLAWIAFSLEDGERGAESGEGGAERAEQRSGSGERGAASGRGAASLGASLGASAGAAVSAGSVALASLALAAAWLGFVALRTQADAAASGVVPDLARIIPATPPAGWAVETRRDLLRFASVLQTEHLLERTYARIDERGRRVNVTVYAAWWPAGATSVSAVATHTPDACWPGAGWEAVPAASRRRELALAAGRVVAEAEQRAFRSQDFPQNVWFWHLVDGRPMRPFEPRSWREQLRLFFDEGVRRDAAQAFVRVSSNLPWEELAAEPLVAEVLTGFAELGVPVRPAVETRAVPAVGPADASRG